MMPFMAPMMMGGKAPSLVDGKTLESVQSLPAMSGNSSPAGHEASAFSTYAGFVAYGAFDQSNGEWASNGDGVPVWIMRKVPAPILVGAYRLKARSGATEQSAKAWQLQGSNNGSSFVAYHTAVGQTAWGDREERYFVVPPESVGSYLYHRLYITELNGSLYAAVGELSLLQYK